MKRYNALMVLPPVIVRPSGISAASSARVGTSIWITALPSVTGRLPNTASRSAFQRAMRDGSSGDATPSSDVERLPSRQRRNWRAAGP